MLTRRSFFQAATAMPFALWLQQRAVAAQPLVRYNARSPQGQAMLKTYAQAVAAMKAKAEGDPRSWLFQWYTHWVAPKDPNLSPFDPQQKDKEISRIYMTPGVWKDLAGDTWDTCQAHGAGMDENNFLPWHRLYLWFFEQIVRTVSGQPSFTLPYWNYSVTGTEHGVLPPEFGKKNDPNFQSLYVENRNDGVNNGDPIDQGFSGDPLSTSSLAQCFYDPQGASDGFCMALDQGLHGNVHVLVGGPQNMGSVPWAARDPIFWLHHCNIDRLWASWNTAGRTNLPLNQRFVFADGNGNRIEANLTDVLDLSKLDYTYDQLEPVPACPREVVAARAPQGAPAPVQKAIATMKAPIQLGAEPVKVPLDTAPVAGGNTAAPFGHHVGALPAGRRLYVVVKDLRTDMQPGVLYELFLDLPADANADKKKEHYVGSVNFFAAAHQGHGQPAKGPERFLSFDITDLAKKLHARNALADKPALSIVPAGKPTADAKPVIGEIRIIEQ